MHKGICEMKSTQFAGMACLALCLSGYALAAAPNVSPAPLAVDLDTAASMLTELIHQAKDPDVKWRAVRALGCLRYKGASPHLLECLQDDHRYVRANAARALGDMRVKAAAAPLIDLLKSEKDGGVIEQSSLALAKLQAREAVPVLKQRASHESLQTRIWVLQAIGRLGSAADVPFLAERLDASDTSEQVCAAEAIENLASVDFELPKRDGPQDVYAVKAAIKRAKEWWAKNKAAFDRK